MTSNTRDEIMGIFAAVLKESGDWDEKVKIMKIPTQEELYPTQIEESKPKLAPTEPKMLEYKDVGESEWKMKDEVDTKKVDDDVMKLIQEDPIHVLTNLMLQRNPQFQKVDYMLPLAKGVIKWLTDSNMSPEEGTVLYDESKYVLDLLESLAK